MQRCLWFSTDSALKIHMLSGDNLHKHQSVWNNFFLWHLNIVPLHAKCQRSVYICVCVCVRSHHEKHMLADTNRIHHQRKWLIVLVVNSCHLIFKSLSPYGEKSSPATPPRKRFRLKASSLCFLNQSLRWLDLITFEWFLWEKKWDVVACYGCRLLGCDLFPQVCNAI